MKKEIIKLNRILPKRRIRHRPTKIHKDRLDILIRKEYEKEINDALGEFEKSKEEK